MAHKSLFQHMPELLKEPEQYREHRAAYEKKSASDNLPRSAVIAVLGITACAASIPLRSGAEYINMSLMTRTELYLFKNLPALSIVVMFAMVLILLLFKDLEKTTVRVKTTIFHIVMATFIISLNILLLLEIVSTHTLYSFYAICLTIAIVPVFTRRSFLIVSLFYVISSTCVLLLAWLRFYPLCGGYLLQFSVVIAAMTAVTILFRLYYNKTVVTNYINKIEFEESSLALIKVNAKLVDLNNELSNLSSTDQLTGVFNRRALDDYLQKTWNECRRSRHPMTVIMMDVDRFKSLNDALGHQKGDECLRAVAQCIKSFFNRSVDMFARYGGEEFIAVLPFTSGTSIIPLAEKIRTAVAELKIPNPRSDVCPYVTISMGIASRYTYQLKNGSADLVTLADEACYTAKRKGRNQIVTNTSSASKTLPLSVHSDETNYKHFDNPQVLKALIKLNTELPIVIDLARKTAFFQTEALSILDIKTAKYDNVYDLSSVAHNESKKLFLDTLDIVFDSVSEPPKNIRLKFRLACGSYSEFEFSTAYVYNEVHEPVLAAASLSAVRQE